MSIHFNHTLVLCRDKDASSRFLADMLGLPAPGTFGDFRVVALDNVAVDQHFVKRCSKPVDVGSMVNRYATFDPLGTHVAKRSDEFTCLCQITVGLQASQPEVRNEEMTQVVDKKIRRLDVTVNESLAMCVFQGSCSLYA